MHLVQFRAGEGRRVGLVEEGNRLRVLDRVETVHGLATAALAAGTGLEAAARAHLGPEEADYAAIRAEGRLLPPVDHPDPAHCLVTGTGLSHLGSAESRDAMHRDLLAADEAGLSDSMKMFRMGLAGGKPRPGETGVQPEWFYKGDGSWLAAPGAPLDIPGFALDGGEEPEIAGLYLIGPDGTPHRLGFALANEFSDHVMERENYLWLAHSKLRTSAIGPELVTGTLPDSVRGVARVRRGGAVVWEKPFLTGEANMSHSIANLEHHHFKYRQFRRPGDLHVHFLGTATLSYADGIAIGDGDVLEVEAEGFGAPLANPVRMAADETADVCML